MVELLNRYSNGPAAWPYNAILRLNPSSAVASAQTAQPDAASRRRSPRLTSSQVDEVIRRYRAGDIIRVIAAELMVDRVTVMRYLRIHGVVTRRRPLTPEQVDRAAAAYLGGSSLARIGDELSVDSSTVWRALIKIGVQMRDTRGHAR